MYSQVCTARPLRPLRTLTSKDFAMRPSMMCQVIQIKVIKLFLDIILYMKCIFI